MEGPVPESVANDRENDKVIADVKKIMQYEENGVNGEGTLKFLNNFYCVFRRYILTLK